MTDSQRPEDTIPDTPENKEAREFLAKAPKKGLWQPLGQDVKVMQCWRCGNFGHRAGDRECPRFLEGNQKLEAQRKIIEDPMASHIAAMEQEKRESKMKKEEAKKKRLAELQQMLREAEEWAITGKLKLPTTKDDSSSSSDGEEKKRKSHHHHHHHHKHRKS